MWMERHLLSMNNMFQKSPQSFIRNASLAVIVLFLLIGSRGQAQPAQSLTLAWNPSTDSTVTGYRLHYGTASGNYVNTLDVSNTTRATLSNLTAGNTYYFVVTAYNAGGAESLPTNEITAIALPLIYGITAVNYLAGGSAQLTVTGSAGLTNKIYGSSDMKSWTLLSTTVNTTGTLMFTDAAATTLNHRFYKATDSTGTTDPAGFTILAVTGAVSSVSPSYSYLGLGMANAVCYKGTVTSFAAQSIADTGAVWNENQFNGTGGGCYIEIVSGSHAGLTTDIVATNATTKTLTTEDDLSAYLAGGEIYKIRRHRTIGDIFGVDNKAGLNGGLTVSVADEIRVLNPVTQAYLTYYYQTGGTGGTGWRSSTDPATDASSTPLYLDQGVILCRKVSGNLSLPLTGMVKTGPTLIPVGTNLNLIANVYPAGTMTLANSGLYNGNSALGLAGSSTVTNADEIRISNGTGFQVYYYKNSGSGGTGWRISTNLRNDAGKTVIPAGASIFVVRKNSRASFIWNCAQPF